MSSIDFTSPTAVPTESSQKLRDLAQVASVFALILLALWTNKPVQLIIGGLTLGYVIVSTLRSRRSRDELGLTSSGFRRSLWVVAAAIAFALALVWIAVDFHTLHVQLGGLSPELPMFVYFVWAMVQQFILQDFFLYRMRRLLPTNAAAVVVTGMLFAAAHLPNPVLTVATVAWGIISCSLFLRYRNLYTLGMAHAILGICIAISVPNSLHHHMRVGLGYLEWHTHAKRVHRSHKNQIVSTEAWVMAEATNRCSARQARP